MSYVEDKRSPYKRGGRGGRGRGDEDFGDDKQSRLQREKPARTLFVRNIAYETSEDVIREMFGKYGEIKKIFNLIPTRGMVFLSYYDLRHADAAKRELQDYELAGRKIDVHYSLPKEDSSDEDDKNKGTLFVTVRDATEPVENEAVKKLFEQWGEIKEVRDCTGSPTQKFIECWDLRDSGKIVQEKQGAPFAGGTLDIKFAYHSTPRSRSERHGGVVPQGGGSGPMRGKFSNRQQTGYSSTPGSGTGVGPMAIGGIGQPNALAILAQAGLSNNVLNQVQLLSQLSQLSALGGTTSAPPAATVQQLAYLIQLQQLQNQSRSGLPNPNVGVGPGVGPGGMGNLGGGAGGSGAVGGVNTVGGSNPYPGSTGNYGVY